MVKSVEKQLKRKEAELIKAENKAVPDIEQIEKLNKSKAGLIEVLQDDVKLKEYYFKKWKTFQISDHLPMWTEIKTDYSTQYLKDIIE